MPKRRILSRLTVRAVEPASPAQRAGLEPGDEILAINGRPARDAIDFMFETADSVVRLDIRREAQAGHHALVREPGESFGLELDDHALNQIITCNNKCPFCFLKGLKPGMRKSLYIKDDDYRLSFLHGNFITLSNLADDDWERLEEQKLSPLYVSVHATEPELRQRMLGNRRARPIAEEIERLRRAGIRIHTQLVVLPGINDGEHLDRSIADLAREYPTVQSISVVPVGVTRYNLGGEGGALRPQTPVEARRLIRQVRPYQRRFREQVGIDLVYLSDEVYLRAGAPVPAGYRYDGFSQYENGVGMSRWLIDGTRRFLRTARHPHRGERLPSAGIVCGTLAAPLLRDLATQFETVTGIRTRVIPVANDFWGHTVAVSGLLAGEDIARRLGEGPDVDLICVSPKSLDASGSVFVDDWTPLQLSQAVGREIAVAETFEEIHRHVLALTGTRRTHEPCAALSAI